MLCRQLFDGKGCSTLNAQLSSFVLSSTLMANIPIPTHLEQDAAGSGDLPTYEDLAQQNGPNSRSVVPDLQASSY